MNKAEFFRGKKAQKLKEKNKGGLEEWTCTETQYYVCKCDCDGGGFYFYSEENDFHK